MESLGDIPSLLLLLGLNSIRMEQTAKGPGIKLAVTESSKSG